MPPQTILEVFDATARAHASSPAMSRKRSGKWESTSWGQYHDLVGRAARALVALGVQPGEELVGFISVGTIAEAPPQPRETLSQNVWSCWQGEAPWVASPGALPPPPEAS